MSVTQLMRHVLFVFLLSFVVGLAAHAQTKRASPPELSAAFSNNEAGYVVNYPSAWSAETFSGFDLVEFGDEVGFMSIEVVERSSMPFSMIEILGIVIAELDDELVDLEISDIPSRRIAGQDSIGTGYRGVDFGYDVVGAVHVFSTDDFVFIIDYDAEVEMIDHYAPIFDAMLDSFTLSKH